MTAFEDGRWLTESNWQNSAKHMLLTCERSSLEFLTYLLRAADRGVLNDWSRNTPSVDTFKLSQLAQSNHHLFYSPTSSSWLAHDSDEPIAFAAAGTEAASARLTRPIQNTDGSVAPIRFGARTKSLSQREEYVNSLFVRSLSVVTPGPTPAPSTGVSPAASPVPGGSAAAAAAAAPAPEAPPPPPPRRRPSKAGYVHANSGLYPAPFITTAIAERMIPPQSAPAQSSGLAVTVSAPPLPRAETMVLPQAAEPATAETTEAAGITRGPSRALSLSLVLPPPPIPIVSVPTAPSAPVIPAHLRFSKRTKYISETVGRLFGQALLEKRLLDLPLSTAMLRALVQPARVFDPAASPEDPSQGDKPIAGSAEAVAAAFVSNPVTELVDPMNMNDLTAIAPDLGRHLTILQTIVQRKNALLYHSIIAQQMKREAEPVAAPPPPPSAASTVAAMSDDDSKPDHKSDKEEKVASAATATAKREELPIPELSADDRAQLKLDGCDIEDLCLDFTVPGWPLQTSTEKTGSTTGSTASSRVVVPLRPGGAEQSVTLDNLDAYVHSVMRFFLIESVAPAFQAIRHGM